MENPLIQDQESALLRVCQFGRFEVWHGSEPIPAKAWSRRKTLQLFKVLLQQRGQVFSQDQLIEALFPDFDPESSTVNLRGRISDLRHALEPQLGKRSDSRYVLTVEGGSYTFSKEAPCWVDTEAFTGHLKKAQECHETSLWELALEHYQAAVELYRGDYLSEDPYEEWTLQARQDFKRRFGMALEGLA